MSRPATSTGKGWAVKVTLCTLAGAIVTWGMAWGCALWGPEAQKGDITITRPSGPWPISVPDGWGEPGCLMEVRTFASESRSWVRADDPHSLKYVTIYAIGCPLRSMGGMSWSRMGSSSEWSMAYAPRWLLPNDNCHGLPTRIILAGFTLNTLLAAGVMLGMVEGLAFARRRVRRAKGRCVACGYDRGGLAGGEATACPECGSVAG